MTVSVWDARGLAGLAELVRVTERVVVSVDLNPPGVATVRDLTIGASIPKRGSGPSVNVETVPSGSVTVRVPSVPITVTVVPSGSPQPQKTVFVRLSPPAGSRWTW